MELIYKIFHCEISGIINAVGLIISIVGTLFLAKGIAFRNRAFKRAVDEL